MKILNRLTYFYLLFPFLLFCVGWLRPLAAIPFLALVIWAFIRLLRTEEDSEFAFRSALVWMTLLWVFLSGVGGYAFQNWDHNWRNAVFRDLITHPFPVIYSAPEKGPITMLVYYVGFWLPSAVVGKLFGWKAANAALFLWTWLGVLLTLTHLGKRIKTAQYKIILFFIFFSGMDALGALIFQQEYPALFPPVQHLEIWMPALQYSSLTTQLFWVFNQSVPAWLCFALILNSKQIDVKILAGALCFFFAPLAAVGLFPYLVLDVLSEFRRDARALFKSLRWDVISAGVMILGAALLYFASNTAAQERGFQSLPILDALAFFLLEGGLIWLILAPHYGRDPRWMLTGVLLFLIPFVQVGSGRDFVMRASIAPLFYLMVMSAESVFENQTRRVIRAALIFILCVGALTPLYEINRSAYRTFQYYFLLDESQRIAARSDPALTIAKAVAPEVEHPNALTADEIYSFARLKDKLAQNFIANVRQSLYYRYLSSR